MILNLTENPVTFIVGGVENSRTIKPSNYVAYLEIGRRCVDTYTFGAESEHAMRAWNVPIYEDVVDEIAVKHLADGYKAALSDVLIRDEIIEENGDFPTYLLVTREVAEAAAILHVCADGSPECDWIGRPHGACIKKGKPHPLSERMVWADEDDFVDATIVCIDENGKSFPEPLIGYRSLRRVPRPC